MPTYTLAEFLAGKADEGNCDLYAVFNGAECLYVGSATVGIYYRWVGTRGHLQKNVQGEWSGISTLGLEITNNLPRSLGWRIEMYYSRDLLALVHEYMSAFIIRTDTRTSEVALIRKYKPSLNSQSTE